MKVHMIIPYSLEKNLGRAYNEVMQQLPNDDWACLMDYDVQLLTPDAGKIIYVYAAGSRTDNLLTCYTNRVSPLSTMQLLGGQVSEIADMRHHIRLAEAQKKFLYESTVINQDISGMLLLINKRLWAEHRFKDNGQCLGVDTEYNRRIRAAGKSILRCDGLYVWHSYRLMNGIYDKKHLK